MYVSGRFNVVKNHLPSIHTYADDIQLHFSFMPLSTSPRHGALRAIQASVSDKNSWEPFTQHCFYFWPVSWSSQCWLSQLGQEDSKAPQKFWLRLLYHRRSSLDGHQPAQDKRYKNGVSLCGFPSTVEPGTTWISHCRGFWNQRPESRRMFDGHWCEKSLQ